MSRRWSRKWIWALALAVSIAAISIVSAPLLARSPQGSDARHHLRIQARQIKQFSALNSDTRFGRLEFRGGLELTSTDKNFGGLSAIHVMPDGDSFLAVTDNADWLRGTIAYQDGKPHSIAFAEMAPMLGPDGRALRSRGWYDTESLTMDGGIVHVGLERVHRIVRYDYGRGGVAARGQTIPVPAALRQLPSNGGIECLASVPKDSPHGGSLIAISESSEGGGDSRGFLIGGAKPGSFLVKRHDDFGITDCVVLPNDDLLLLERFFSYGTGVKMRMRRIPLSEIEPGRVVDGERLIDANMGHQIDNMEGLSVHSDADGKTVLTLVSDDNFSAFQRTLLLQFTLHDQ